MKILYFGGQKSGKTTLAEERSLEISKERKPLYLATYDNSYNDGEMEKRINSHKKKRNSRFKIAEEPLAVEMAVKKSRVNMVDCINMWVLNMMMAGFSYKKMKRRVEKLLNKEADMVFVLNDLSKGVIPSKKFSREYVDAIGQLGQLIASKCDEVYSVEVGIGRRIK